MTPESIPLHCGICAQHVGARAHLRPLVGTDDLGLHIDTTNQTIIAAHMAAEHKETT